MNRQERRKRERQAEKKLDVLRKLPEKEFQKIAKIIDEVTTHKTNQMMDLIDKTLEAVLINIGFRLEDVRKVKIMLADFLEDEEDKLKIISKENMNMAKLQKEVTQFMKGLIEQGKCKSDVIEETLYKFPKASKNLVNREFGKLKEEQDIADATNYIFGEEEAKEIAKSVADNLEKELDKEEPVVEEKIVEEVKEEIKEKNVMSKLRVKKVELEGEFGSYIREGNKVVAGEITFNSLEELEEYQRKEIELFNKRMEEIREVYKIG